MNGHTELGVHSCPAPSVPPQPSKGWSGFETVFVGVCILCCDMVYHTIAGSLESSEGCCCSYHQTLLSLLSRYYYRRYRTRLHTARLRRYITHGHYCLKHTQKLCVKKLSFRDFLILRFEVKHSDTVSLFWSLFTVNILHSFSRFLSINIWFSSYYKTTVIYYKLLPLLPVHLEYTQLHAHTLITTCFAINTI